jgi:HEAT repeat protein
MTPARRRNVIDTLLKGINHESVRVRIYSTRALGKLRCREAEHILVKQLKQGKCKDVRETAAGVLQYSTDPYTLQALRDAAMDPNWRIRKAAVLSLYGREGDEDVDALVKVFEDDLHPEVRSSALRALAFTYSPEVLPAVLAAARDPVRRIRSEFCYVGSQVAKKGIGENEIVDAYIALLSDPEVYCVAARAASGLGIICNRRGIPPLINTIKKYIPVSTPAEERITKNAVFSLGCMPDLRAFPVLKQAAESKNTSLRSAAIRSLGNYGPYAVDCLGNALRDPDLAVQHTAIQHLSYIDTVESIKKLIDAVSNPQTHPLSRKRIIWHLRYIVRDPSTGNYISRRKYSSWNADKWRDWWQKAKESIAGRRTPKTCSSRSGKFKARIHKHTVSLLDEKGNILWIKLRFPHSGKLRGQTCRVSDHGWIMLGEKCRIISRTGDEPDKRLLCKLFPREEYMRIWNTCISPDGNYAAILTGKDNKGWLILSNGQGKVFFNQPYSQQAISTRLVFSPDSQFIACLPGMFHYRRRFDYLIPFPDEFTEVSLFSRNGKRIDIPVVKYNYPGYAQMSWKIYSTVQGPVDNNTVTKELKEVLRKCNAYNCTGLLRKKEPKSAGAAAKRADAEVPWDTLIAENGVLLGCPQGLFLIQRESASQLVEMLGASDIEMRKLAIRVLAEMAGHTFGYIPASSLSERSRTIKRWRTWVKDLIPKN